MERRAGQSRADAEAGREVRRILFYCCFAENTCEGSISSAVPGARLDAAYLQQTSHVDRYEPRLLSLPTEDSG